MLKPRNRKPFSERQEISCPVHSHHVALLLVGLRSCHSGCAQQALPECSAHQYYSFRLIQVTTYLGYFLMAIPAGFFINRYGYRRGVVFGLLLFGVGALLFIPGATVGSFSAFLLCLFIIGCGLVFLETAANPYVTELGAKETATSRLNLSQSFNGLGSIFATLCIGQFLFNHTEEGGNVVVPYTILGILVLVIALVFSRVDLPEISHVATAEDEAAGSNISKLFSITRCSCLDFWLC